ncbi:MAG: O-antigen polysaccharide polymerase Wzy [Pyrinomonadaceae bacterium]
MQALVANHSRYLGWLHTKRGMHLYLGVSATALLVAPTILTRYDYSWQVAFLAVLLIAICVYPSARYFSRREAGLPTMSVFCLAYAMQFAFPIFAHDDTFLLLGAEVRYLAEADVLAGLVMAIVGIIALQSGFYWFQTSKHRRAIPITHLHLKKEKALLYCLLVGIFLPLLFTFKGIIPEEFQQPLSSILRLLETQVLVVIGILGWLVYGRKESLIYAVWLYGLVLVTSMRGISNGTLEEALVPFGVLFVVKWVYTRKVPLAPILMTALIVIFLSPVKSDYRQQAWLGNNPELAEESTLTRGTLWITQALEYWSDTVSGSRDLAEATASSTDRADFVHQVAYIHSMTPAVVPYQNGATYAFFLVAIIPRAIWPDKPVAGTANAFYAVTYGVTNEEGARTTTFGVSILGEAFMNFGWPGVVFIMLLMGILISALQHAFGGSASGPGGQAVFLAFFVYFLNGIGSSAEIMFGGILQNLLCGYVLLLWARDKSVRLEAYGRNFKLRSSQLQFPASTRDSA